MAPQLVYCFDYASPYSYFANSQLAGLLERTGAEIEYRPILLGGVFKSTGNVSPVFEKCEPKRDYGMRTMRRWVEHYAVPFKMNPHFPVNTVNLMRTCTAALLEGQPVFDTFHAAIFPAMWVDGRNLGEPAEIGRHHGGETPIRRTQAGGPL